MLSMMPIGVLNFAYGTGPYLRTAELAIAFNDELQRRGRARMAFIVPWLYGAKQKRIMLEEFSSHENEHPAELLLDAELGALLRLVSFGDKSYPVALATWATSVREVSQRAQEHLSSRRIAVETLDGKKLEVDPRNIVVELNRSPRIRYDIAPAYLTTFGYVEEILRGALAVGRPTIAIDKAALQSGAKAARWIETSSKLRAIAYPATFSGTNCYSPWYHDDMLAPPLTSPPESNTDRIETGIYVTVSGIPSLRTIYRAARDFGLPVYCNDPHAVEGSVAALPQIVPNSNIIFQFARSGWGSVWLSLLSGTPILVPEHAPEDDPEIYFNNKTIESLGIGIVYHGQSLRHILKVCEAIRENCAALRRRIIERWGTLNGHTICAKLFVDDFLSEYASA